MIFAFGEFYPLLAGRRETGTVIDDGLREVFVNAAVHDGTAIDELMRCFKQSEIDNERFPRLTKRVSELKATEGGTTAVCDVMRKYEEIAKAEGRAEGEAKGEAKAKVGVAKKLIASCGFTDEQISELTGLSVEEIAAIRSGSVA